VHVALSGDSEARDILERFGTQREVSELDKYSEIVSNEIWSKLSVHPPDTGLIALAKKPSKRLSSPTTKFTGDTVVFMWQVVFIVYYRLILYTYALCRKIRI